MDSDIPYNQSAGSQYYSQLQTSELNLDDLNQQFSRFAQSAPSIMEIPHWKGGSLEYPQIPLKLKEDEWKKREYCTLCKRDFGTLSERQHHCRICGDSVCGNCSTKKINNERCCDLCFMQKCLRPQIKAVKAELEKKEEDNQYKKKRLQDLEIEVKSKEKEIKKDEQIYRDQKRVQLGEIKKQQELLEKSKLNLNKRCQVYRDMSKSVEVDQEIQLDNEQKFLKLQGELAKIKNQIEAKQDQNKKLKKQIEQNDQKVEKKQKEAEKLYKNQQMLTQHKSISILQNDMPSITEDLNREQEGSSNGQSGQLNI